MHLGAITSVGAQTTSPVPSLPANGQIPEKTDAERREQSTLQSRATATAERQDFLLSRQTSSADHPPSLQSQPTFTTDTEGSVDSRQTGTVGEREQQRTIVDVVHARVSLGIQGAATWMDSFFGDTRYESELNESYVRFQYDVFKEEGKDLVTPRPDVRIRIILPQLKRRTRLVFSGTPKERSDFSVIGAEPDNAADEESDVSAGVQQTLLDTLKNNLSIRVGVRLHDKKPLIVFGPRYRMLFPLDSWQLRFIEEITWTNQTGWESTTTFDAERKVLENLFFRASNTWNWNEDMRGFIYDISFGLAQPIDERRALGYELINSFHTRPIHELTDVALRVRYRQQLWRRKWLFLELAPQYHFPRSNSFHGLAGILFRLEMLIGKYR